MEWTDRIGSDNNPWFLGLAFLILMLGLMRRSEGHRLELFMRAYFNPNLLNQQVRQERGYNRITLPILAIIFIGLDLFLIQASSVLEWEFFTGFYDAAVWIGVSLIGTTFARWLVYVSFGLLFELQWAFRMFMQQWMLHNFMLALVLLPCIILIQFGPSYLDLGCIYLGLFFAALTYLLRAFRLFSLIHSELHPPLIYNVLYFCALEILPPLIIAASII
jgi:hypothetical protein